MNQCELCDKKKNVRKVRLVWHDFARKYVSGKGYIEHSFWKIVCKKCLLLKVAEFRKNNI